MLKLAQNVAVGDVVEFEPGIPVRVLNIEDTEPEYECTYTRELFGRSLCFDCTSDLDGTELDTFYVRRERSALTGSVAR